MAGRADDPLDRARRPRDRGLAHDAAPARPGRCRSSRRSTADPPGAGTPTSPSRSRTASSSPTPGSPSCSQPARQHRPRARVRAGASSATRAGRTSPTSWPASTPASRTGSRTRTGSASPAVLRRVHGRLGRGPDRPVQGGGGDVGRRRLPVVPPHVGGRRLGRGDPRRALGRSRRRVHGSLAGRPCASLRPPRPS